MVDISICQCGGLTYKCRRYGHLPYSIGHYKGAPPKEPITVVWSGTIQREQGKELLDDREEHPDERYLTTPTYDLDDGEVLTVAERRKYTLTGRHVGKFSRTNPDAPQYIPSKRPSEAGSEESNGRVTQEA